MANIIFTNAESYAQVHEAFRLDNLNALAAAHGFVVFANIIDYETYPEYSHVTYTTPDNLKSDFAAFCATQNPSKIVNYIDYLTQWDDVTYTGADVIYFVRSLYAEVKAKHSNQTTDNDHWLEREQKWITAADKVICASPTSKAAIKSHYNIDADMMLEYVNPTKYLEMNMPTAFAKNAHFTGRFDSQKRFDLINNQTDWTITGIGNNALDASVHANITTYDILTFEEYKTHITDSVFGLYPAVWESNGFGVQECLAMGKIPIIHTGSGGHERLCNNTNSISIDWTNDNWWEEAESQYNNTMHQAARDSLTVSMYETSRDLFLNAIL